MRGNKSDKNWNFEISTQRISAGHSIMNCALFQAPDRITEVKYEKTLNEFLLYTNYAFMVL